jgi:hypothetical protein
MRQMHFIIIMSVYMCGALPKQLLLDPGSSAALRQTAQMTICFVIERTKYPIKTETNVTNIRQSDSPHAHCASQMIPKYIVIS